MVKDYTLKNKEDFVLTEDQNEIVEALLKHNFFFNCAQTGFGKTFTTITAAIYKMIERKDEDIHFMLILPGSAVKAFSDTFNKILGIPFNIYTATHTRAKKGARFHIFNYTTLSADVFTPNKPSTNPYLELFKKIRRKYKNMWLVIDEIHSLQDPSTNQYMLVNSLRSLFIGIWGLTATPILNNLDGLYHMTNIVSPGFLGTNIYSFRNTYCTFKENYYFITKFGKRIRKTKKEIDGYKNLEKLQNKFAEISIIKSRHYNVKFNFRSAELSDEMIKYYKYAAKGLFSGKAVKGKSKKSKQSHHGARLHDLQRVVSNSHKDFKLLKDPKKLTEKEMLLINTIKEVLDKDEAVLIYFGYHETIDRIRYILQYLQKKLRIPNIFEVTGKIKQADRKKVESAIGPRDIVLITSAGTESINLQRANNLIFYETPFPIREFTQACGRITRMNTTFDAFNVYILEAVGTIDTYKKERIKANSAPIKSVLGGSNILPTEVLILTAEDKKVMKDEYLWWK